MFNERVGELLKVLIARFRNVLVHEYFRIDLEIVHGKLQNLDIFRRLARAIVELLEERCPSAW
ncbi:MAG TPA: DUF86 domain-containing protein [Candidatus Latescibacteria bacterium]|nr:DUF86 domain-containing protein [Candidatus Latescibacterota bacterium]